MKQARHREGLDGQAGLGKNAVAIQAVVIIEHPDDSGERWRAALDLLLEAGRIGPKGNNPE